MKKIVAFMLVLVFILQFPLQTNAADSKTYPTYKDTSGNIVMENDYLKVTFGEYAVMTVVDKRTGENWATDGYWLDSPLSFETNKVFIRAHWNESTIFDAQFELSADKPEIECTILGVDNFGEGGLFPQPFVSDGKTDIILPYGTGIRVSAADKDFPELGLPCYGWGVSMPFNGLIRNESSCMVIVDTPADANFWVNRVIGSSAQSGLLNVSLGWQSQKHELGYQRKATLVFFDSNSIVPMAKRYRDDAMKLGYIKTFSEKSQEIPNIDKLVGAISVWADDEKHNKLLADFKKYGIERFNYTDMGWYDYSPWTLLVDSYVKQGKLFGCSYSYTIVSERDSGYCMQPNEFHNAWPNDLLKDENGNNIASGVTWRSGTRYELGLLCSACIEKWQKIVEPQVPKNYNLIYLDGISAQDAKECYDPKHPTTRTEYIDNIEKYLSYYHQIGKVVEGEGCTYNNVPNVDSAEANGSYGFCYTEDAGDNPFHKLYNPSDTVLKYSLGQKYRIPLWELVFHDCILTMPYWGDTSCTYPDYWYKRDLFAILYGNSMNYAINYDFFQQYLPEFVASYNRITTVARAVGYAEMTNFVYLTEDRNVQMTEYSNGVKIIVNFGETPYSSADGSVIGACSYKTIGIGTADLTYTHLTPNSAKVTVNGKTVAFEAYTINGSNYFKLRDIAMALSGTGTNFNVSWDGANNAVSITTGTKYAPVGGELKASTGLSPRMGYQSDSVIYVNGQKAALAAYTINGNNYIKLRDLGTTVGFGVG
jgi:hypothetical protein